MAPEVMHSTGESDSSHNMSPIGGPPGAGPGNMSPDANPHHPQQFPSHVFGLIEQNGVDCPIHTNSGRDPNPKVLLVGSIEKRYGHGDGNDGDGNDDDDDDGDGGDGGIGRNNDIMGGGSLGGRSLGGSMGRSN